MKKTALSLALLATSFTIGFAQPVTQPFTFSLVEQSLPQLRSGSVSWGDVDGDGDLDALISGLSESGVKTALYRNDGASASGSGFAFTDMQAGLSPVLYSSASWGDFDGDGDLDFVLMGSESVDFPYQPVTRLYRNTGGIFSLVSEANLPALHSGSAAWGDFDNDGDQDLLLTGVDSGENRLTKLARNVGAGSFEMVDSGIDGVGFGEGKWGDFDNDGDLDVLLSGATETGFATRIYRNDGSDGFVMASEFDPLAFSSVDWGDYDGDGDLDLVIAGGQVSPFILEGVTRVYRNEGGTFQSQPTGVTGILSGSVRWGDFDNDGDLDLLTLGAESALERRTARVFRNDGDGAFVNTGFLIGGIFASSDWGDLDGDGDLDLLASGATSAGISFTNLYENKRQVIPPPPGSPKNLRSEVHNGSVELRWDAPVVEITPNAFVSYNLRVGKGTHSTDIISPLANPVTGRRLIARPGNTATNLSWTLSGLANGEYFWSVQAINNAFAASPFSAEGSFRISGVTAVDTESEFELPTEFRLYSNFPNPFGSETTVRYDLPSAEVVSVRIYDLLGKEVARLIDTVQEAGTHSLRWSGHTDSGQTLGSGIYFLRFEAGDFVRTEKLTHIR